MSPSIGFHVWHLARWADRVQASIAGLTPRLAERLGPGRETWEAEELADRWGFATDALGHGRTGSGMDDADAEALPLPGKDVLLDYAERAFAAADRAFAAIDDEQFGAACKLTAAHGPVLDTTVGHVMTSHLGMIECLRGLQGERGSATM